MMIEGGGDGFGGGRIERYNASVRHSWIVEKYIYSLVSEDVDGMMQNGCACPGAEAWAFRWQTNLRIGCESCAESERGGRISSQAAPPP